MRREKGEKKEECELNAINMSVRWLEKQKRIFYVQIDAGDH